MGNDAVLEMKSNERDTPVIIAALSLIDVAAVFSLSPVYRFCNSLGCIVDSARSRDCISID